MIYPKMPYPDFKTLKHIPPDKKLAYLHASLDDSWQLPIDYQALSLHNFTPVQSRSFSFNDPRYRYEINFNKSAKPRMPKKVSILALIIGLNGKLIWTLLFYMLWGALAITLSVWVHPASLLSVLVVFIAFVAMMMISLWMGAIFTLTSYSLRMGLSSTAFMSAPAFAFAGVTFPLLAMSDGARLWANILPLTHYLKVQIAQLQMLAPASISMPTVIGLLFTVIVLLIITALLSLRAFRNPEKWGAR